MSGKLPAALPTSTNCFCISVPNGDWSQWVWGALLSLTLPSAWDDDPTTVTQAEGASVFMEVLQSMSTCTLVPTGAVMEWPSSNNIPNGFLEANGQSISVDDYPELFDVIGYTWGGSGGNFNLPDKSGKVSAGVASGHALASSEGERAHSLSGSEGPSHWHLISNVSLIPVQVGTGAFALSTYPGGNWATGSSGSGTAHNNMQPTQYTRFMIAAGRNTI